MNLSADNCSELKCSWLKCSEGISKRASNIMIRYIDNTKFTADMGLLSITFFHIVLIIFFIILYMVICFVSFCLMCKLCIFYCYVH
jgi:hypothetical protein